jgi:hypothetical protein
MAWAGTGMLCARKGGILTSLPLGSAVREASQRSKRKGVDFGLIQISDSHIGFHQDANPDVTARLQVAVDHINNSTAPPEFLVRTGDISHRSKPSEFEPAGHVLRGTKVGKIFYVPGEHDVLAAAGEQDLDRFGRETQGKGYSRFDHKGVHFVGLVNVLNLQAGGRWSLGQEQLDWIERDVKHLKSSTPILVFVHIPLRSIYPKWGWGTDDSAQALGHLKRFGSVSVLNGNIHQVLQKVEGHVTIHRALSTTFPQPAPGTTPSPGPRKVPADHLRNRLGISHVNFVRGAHSLAVVDSPRASTARLSIRQKTEIKEKENETKKVEYRAQYGSSICGHPHRHQLAEIGSEVRQSSIARYRSQNRQLQLWSGCHDRCGNNSHLDEPR